MVLPTSLTPPRPEIAIPPGTAPDANHVGHDRSALSGAPSHAEAAEYQAFLRDLLSRAGAAASHWFRRAPFTTKRDGSHVTAADAASQDVIVDGLSRAYPSHGIVSEEGAFVEGSPVWYVDPIDGTSAFIEELAHWGPTVALSTDRGLEVGALWLPRLGEMWFAYRGAGAFRDDVRLRPPPLERVERWHTMYLPSRYHRRLPLAWPGKSRALGSSAVHLAQVASGSGTAAFIGRWNRWDVGCGILLNLEAGRAITDLQGRPFDAFAHVGEPFLAADPIAVPVLVELIRRVGETHRQDAGTTPTRT